MNTFWGKKLETSDKPTVNQPPISDWVTTRNQNHSTAFLKNWNRRFLNKMSRTAQQHCFYPAEFGFCQTLGSIRLSSNTNLSPNTLVNLSQFFFVSKCYWSALSSFIIHLWIANPKEQPKKHVFSNYKTYFFSIFLSFWPLLLHRCITFSKKNSNWVI
jgi:hypothetical protein